MADPWRCDAHDFEEIVRAVSTAGFRSAAFWSDRPIELGVGAVKKVLDEAGVRPRMVEVRTQWAEGPEAAVDGLDEKLDTVAELGSDRALAISKQTAMDVSRATEGFAALCERADERGLKVTIEFLPCRGLNNLATAWAVVGGSGAANGGIDIDLMHWHYQPGGPDLDLLRTIPPAHIHFVQVCDARGPAPSMEEYIPTAMRDRHLPGDGDVDISAVLSVLQDGGADPFLAMEVFNDDLLARGPESMARRVWAAADALFSAHVA